MFRVNQRVMITAGHWKGRPAIVREVNKNGSYRVTLTDTPGPDDVTIKRIEYYQMRAL